MILKRHGDKVSSKIQLRLRPVSSRVSEAALYEPKDESVAYDYEAVACQSQSQGRSRVFQHWFLF